MLTNFARAIQALLDSLVCPKCAAMNRPGAHVIELENGRATCGVCSHSWTVTQGD